MQPAKLVDKLIRDKHGKIVVWQNPNLPLGVWFVSMLLERLLPDGPLNQAADLVAFGSLFTWAWLEIFQGSSYFRRMLGATVLIIIIASRIN